MLICKDKVILSSPNRQAMPHFLSVFSDSTEGIPLAVKKKKSQNKYSPRFFLCYCPINDILKD